MIVTQLWADGSGTSSGPIGWAWTLLAVDTETGEVRGRREGAGAFRDGTNNRAELLAVIDGLVALQRPTRLTVYSDSEYVCNPFRHGWLDGWRRNDWRTSQRSVKDAAAACPTCGATGQPGEICARHDPMAYMRADFDRKAVRNRDLWKMLLDATRWHRLTFEHVKGHAGVELNEDCDRRAGEARRAEIDRLAALAGQREVRAA